MNQKQRLGLCIGLGLVCIFMSVSFVRSTRICPDPGGTTVFETYTPIIKAPTISSRLITPWGKWALAVIDSHSSNEVELTTASADPVVLEVDKTQIRDLKPGTSGWTTPFAMWIDKRGQRWLDPTHTIHTEPSGTISMRVERKYDGYGIHAIDYFGEHYVWYKGVLPSYADEVRPWIPVTSFTQD